ncbi:hypothetical protein J3R83DRAFT_12169, partial [Lanmaoa asiatica]
LLYMASESIKPPKQVIKLSEKAKLGLKEQTGQNPKKCKGNDLTPTLADPLKKARIPPPGGQALAPSKHFRLLSDKLEKVSDPSNTKADNRHASSEHDPVEVEAIEIVEETPNEQLHPHNNYGMRKWAMLMLVIECQMKDRTSPIYAFFEPKPVIEEHNERCSHLFKCASRSCKTTIWHYLDTKDARSTGNMCKHARKCWGDEVISAVDDAKDANEARTKVVGGILKNSKSTQSFERKGKE